MQTVNITYDTEKKIFHLFNSKISYIMELKENTLLHRYWGKNLRNYNGANCPQAVNFLPASGRLSGTFLIYTPGKRLYRWADEIPVL